MLIAPYNNLETTADIIHNHADDLAAIIVEPLHRCTTPAPGFLEGLRQVTKEQGVLLIFDEVVTGYRMHRVLRDENPSRRRSPSWSEPDLTVAS